MEKSNRLLVFILFFVIAFIYWRIYVFLLFNKGDVSFFRAMSGLSIHHYHYGLLIILIASLLLIFHKVNGVSIGLMGFGLGSVFDSFVARLFPSGGTRVGEIINYNQSFSMTSLVFMIIILLSVNFYLISRQIEIKFINKLYSKKLW